MPLYNAANKALSNLNDLGTTGQVLTSNGAGAAPTFQAVGGGATINTFIAGAPLPVATAAATTVNSNVVGHTSAFWLPFQITVTKLSIHINAVTTEGTLDIGVYSEDGQTQQISITTASIAGAGVSTTAVASVVLSPGLHWLVIVPNGTASLTVRGNNPNADEEGLYGGVTSEPILSGTQTVTASTLPTTFDPTALSVATHNNFTIFRMD